MYFGLLLLVYFVLLTCLLIFLYKEMFNKEHRKVNYATALIWLFLAALFGHLASSEQ